MDRVFPDWNYIIFFSVKTIKKNSGIFSAEENKRMIRGLYFHQLQIVKEDAPKEREWFVMVNAPADTGQDLGET